MRKDVHLKKTEIYVIRCDEHVFSILGFPRKEKEFLNLGWKTGGN